MTRSRTARFVQQFWGAAFASAVLAACGCGGWLMPERDAVLCDLGDGYQLIAAGVKRETSSELTADLMLQNGKVLYADRAVLNTAGGRQSWAQAAGAATQEVDGPTGERIAQALL